MSKKLQLLTLAAAAAALSTSALAQVRTGVGELPDYPTNVTARPIASAAAIVATPAPASVGEAPSYPLAQGGTQPVAASGHQPMRMSVKHNHENFQTSPN